jgi:hypothetical protein
LKLSLFRSGNSFSYRVLDNSEWIQLCMGYNVVDDLLDYVSPG